MADWGPMPRSIAALPLLVRTLALVVLGSGAAACVAVDECSEGATRCDSPTRLERCETGYDPPESPHWERTDCDAQGLICTHGTTGIALCAVSAEPVAACAGVLGERCDGDRLVACAEGLASYEATCEATCVATMVDAPFCVLDATPHPLCEVELSTCDGATRIDCRDGYRTRAVSCAGAGGCQVATITYQNGDFATAICALGATPDPRCPEADNLAFAGQSSFCEGDLLFECLGGYLVQRLACAPRPDGEDACVTPRPGDSECSTTQTVIEGTERGTG